MRFLGAFLLLAACANESVSGYAGGGTWRLTELHGEKAAREATLAFDGRTRLRGETACFGWSAQQTAPYPWFVLSHMRIEDRPCPPAAQRADEAILDALASATLSEGVGDVLILSDDEAPLLVFTRQAAR